MILALGDYMSVLCHSCIGGTNIGEDIRKLDFGQHVISGTPGRVFDMIKRRNLRTRSIKMLILDEADEMLNKGKQNDVALDIMISTGFSSTVTANCPSVLHSLHNVYQPRKYRE